MVLSPEDKQKIREYIPNNFVVFKIKSNNPDKEIKLKSAEWAIITQVDGEKTIEDISKALSLEEDEALFNIYNLYSQGLIEVEKIERPKHIFVEPELFGELEKILVNIIGPVASFLINDVLLDMEASRDEFLKENIPALTEAISQEINDEQKRVQFQQEMLKKIKHL